jgi:hypothetical protein
MDALQALTLLGLFIFGALGESLNRDIKHPPRKRKTMTTQLATVTWLEGRNRITRTAWIRQNGPRIYHRPRHTWQILCYTDQLLNITTHRTAR